MYEMIQNVLQFVVSVLESFTTALSTEDTFYDMLYVVGLIGLIIILLIVLFSQLAKRGAWFTEIEQGTTIFIVVGGRLKSILSNIGGHRLSFGEDLSGRRWIIPDNNEKNRRNAFFYGVHPGTRWLQEKLWDMLGIRFMSILWPQVGKLKFQISRKRLVEKGNGESEVSLAQRIKDSDRPTTVDHLLFIAPRPVFVEGLELAGDNARVNVLLLCSWQQVIPAQPVIYLKGDFFPLMDEAIRAALVNFCATHRVAVFKKNEKNSEKEGQFAHHTYTGGEGQEDLEPSPLTYAHWLKLSLSGKDSPIVKAVLSLNMSDEYYERMKRAADEEENGNGKESAKKEIIAFIETFHRRTEGNEVSGVLQNNAPDGFVVNFGWLLENVRVVEHQAHGDTKALAEALRAKETNARIADGQRQEATGDRDAMALRAEGERARFAAIEAMTKLGVHPDVAAGVLDTQIRTGNMSKAGFGTYVEGGASTGVLVSPSETNSRQKKTGKE